jgi:DMSO/TMAO reductase YedYZ molybdopterin-dependent catalytic subunit
MVEFGRARRILLPGTPRSEGRMTISKGAVGAVTDRPFNAETPLPELRHAVTPTGLFYVRSHYEVPAADPVAWRLRLDGALERPARLELAALRALPARTLRVTLECAGNGRNLLRPLPPGTPWGLGAASTAEFTGVPLRTVLEPLGIDAAAVEVLFVGADGRESEEAGYARSLPLEVALAEDTLLAWAMNGEPLLPDHGFPLRLVVPGWYAMASVKWLEEVRVLTEPFLGHYQASDYLYLDEEGTDEGTPVTRMRVRSLVTRPAAGAVLPLGPVEVAGTAWSGSGPVAAVEVSADGGRSWRPAELEEAGSPFAARRWRAVWTPAAPGSYTLLARATDAAGERQPLAPRWNRQGYGNNGCHAVPVTIRPA